MLFNYFTISSLINALTSFIFCFFVFTRNSRSQLNRSFALFAFSVGFWAINHFLAFGIQSEVAALFFHRALMAGAIFIPSTFFHFVCVLLGIYDKKKSSIVYGYIASFIFFLSDFTPLFIPSVSKKLFFEYFEDFGPMYHPFLIMFAGFTLYSHYLMFRGFKSNTGARRNQIKYVFAGTLIGFIGGSTSFFLVYNIPIPPVGNCLVTVYIVMVAIAIIRHRLMDINIALTRAGIFVVVYTLVLGIPFWAGYKYGLWQLATWITVVLATLGPFIYIFLQRQAEDRLLKEQRRYQNTLKQASLGMTRIRNLSKLLDLITHIVTKTVKLAYAGIYLYNNETNEFVLQVSRDKGRISVPKLTPDNPLLSWIANNRQPLVYEEIKRLREDNNDAAYKLLEENMRFLTATVVVPCFLEDRFLGFFVLGEKISGQIYTPEDLNVFQVLAAQAALAIENARFFEETKQMQEQIATAEKMATIGTMADGLSHQINNRFYALSLIAADTIDTIKMTDTSNCSPEVKEAFSQISHALERVKANVIQGGEVVRGMLKYTRKGEEGLEPLTLDHVLDSTLDMVQYKVKLSEIDIIRNYPKDHPKIRGNSVQLQEVFFNFIDNGYDSTVERKTILKEPNYRGRITFSAQSQQKNGMLLITVEDNGLGIKDADKKRLFTPFFTTKASSRQGTGLGLYVIKRIIEETHKGKIWFESEYGKGTRFFLQLPIAKENNY